MKTLIRNATVVFPDREEFTHILLDAGKIADTNASADSAADEVVDASGLHLLPGVIDDQVHFRDPGLTHKEDLHTGSRACAKGGVTTFLEMPNTKPATVSTAALHDKLQLAAEKSLVNYGFYIGATVDNVAELQKAERTPGIKIFIGSSTGNLLVDEQAALERIFAETTLPICAHCEDEATVRANSARFDGGRCYADHSRIRDHAAALTATRRVQLAERHRHPFHVLHVSTADEVRFLRTVSELITAEVCPHHLFFNVDDYDRLESLVQMNPSIKTAADNQELWAGLLDGTIDLIATDHAPHTLEEKRQPYPKSPSGLPAVENSLALMLNEVNRGRCTLLQVVRWMSEAPAQVWKIAGKGRIESGYDADLVLVDMTAEFTILNEGQETKSRWSPWHGTTLKGQPVRTFVAGHTVFDRGLFDDRFSWFGSDFLSLSLCGVPSMIDIAKAHVAQDLAHDQPLISCAFDPTGRYVFAGGEDFTLWRFELATAAKTACDTDAWVRAIGFSKDGSLMITGGYDGRLIWWPTNAESPQPQRTAEAHQGWIRELAVSPDGTLIATVGNDLVVRLWNISDGSPAQELTGHESHIYNVAFHPSGCHLVTGDLMGNLIDWDLSAGKQVRTWQAKSLSMFDKTFVAQIGGFRGMAFTPDGSRLLCSGITAVTNAFAGIGNPSVVSFDWSSGEQKVEHLSRGKLQGVAWGVAAHPNGTVITSTGGRGGYLLFWKPDEVNEFHSLKLAADSRDMDLSPDGLSVATAHYNGHVYVTRLEAASK